MTNEKAFFTARLHELLRFSLANVVVQELSQLADSV